MKTKKIKKEQNKQEIDLMVARVNLRAANTQLQKRIEPYIQRVISNLERMIAEIQKVIPQESTYSTQIYEINLDIQAEWRRKMKEKE